MILNKIQFIQPGFEGSSQFNELYLVDISIFLFSHQISVDRLASTTPITALHVPVREDTTIVAASFQASKNHIRRGETKKCHKSDWMQLPIGEFHEFWEV